MLKELVKATYKDDVMNVVNKLVNDRHDNVRMFAIKFFHKIPEEYEIDLILPFYEQLFEDKSWRVKHSVCDAIRDICIDISKRIGDQNVGKYVLHHYCNYMTDEEIQLRIRATQQLSHFILGAHITSENIIEHIIPIVNEMVESPNTDLREALAGSVLSLSNVLQTKKNTIDH
jgi:hypothetical protein